ncbi:hypothetical protein SDC9_148172 [bioreactor metagenome]|uniref:Uncharacterized protein n=1 Tax=bioreactor metagenome TaxID=1076179 RepID=A0A645EJS8_9ZZZZ
MTRLRMPAERCSCNTSSSSDRLNSLTLCFPSTSWCGSTSLRTATYPKVESITETSSNNKNRMDKEVEKRKTTFQTTPLDFLFCMREVICSSVPNKISFCISIILLMEETGDFSRNKIEGEGDHKKHQAKGEDAVVVH